MLDMRHFLTHTAAIESIDRGATDENDRTTVIASIKCSKPHYREVYDVERSSRGPMSGSVASPMEVIVDVPGVPIERGMRFVSGGLDHRIERVEAWPALDPKFYRLFLQDEQES